MTATATPQGPDSSGPDSSGIDSAAADAAQRDATDARPGLALVPQHAADGIGLEGADVRFVEVADFG